MDEQIYSWMIEDNRYQKEHKRQAKIVKLVYIHMYLYNDRKSARTLDMKIDIH